MGDRPDVELQKVKAALQDGVPYNGMDGEALQRYFLKLNEQDNRRLAHELGSSINDTALETTSTSQPRLPPPGPPAPFDKNNLVEVHAHLCTYEAVPSECVRALRAVVSLAYDDAAKVAQDHRILEQMMRVSSFHAGEASLQCTIARVFGHLAYDANVACGPLAETPVLETLLSIMAEFPCPKEAGVKASEALARVAAAETNPHDEQPPPSQLPSGCSGRVLRDIFSAAFTMDEAKQSAAITFATLLVANEVVHHSIIVSVFVSTGFLVASAVAAAAWLRIARGLADGIHATGTMGPALVAAGAFGHVVELMERFPQDPAVQLAGVESIAVLLNTSRSGLQAFAAASGVRFLESAMQQHTGEARLQLVCVRLLKDAIRWPRDLQTQAGFNSGRAVDLMKAGMAAHVDSLELQTTALEAMALYIDKLHCHHLVKLGGGEGLVKAVMIRHSKDAKVQTWGKIVLDAIGLNRFWTPKGAEFAPQPGMVVAGSGEIVDATLWPS